MAVYVDDMYKSPMGQFGRMKMSHMIADTHEELMDMAQKIGINKKWIQYPGAYREHFDVSMSLRKKAVEFGAIEITMRQLADKTAELECNLYLSKQKRSGPKNIEEFKNKIMQFIAPKEN